MYARASTSRDFHISVDVHQSSALSPLLLLIVFDASLETFRSPQLGRCCTQMVMLSSEHKKELEQQTQEWSERLIQFVLRLDVMKTEYLNNTEHGTIRINNVDLPSTIVFFNILAQWVSS